MTLKPEALALSPPRSKLADLFVLAKVRLNSLVVASTAAGYYMARPEEVSSLVLVSTCLGTALVAGGAAALNQLQERDIDRLMERTRLRPVADGRMPTGEARTIGFGLVTAGLLILWLAAGALASAIALATLGIYTLIYTPLKRKTSLCTVIGAVPGALPPLIGWAAARGSLDLTSWVLFLIMFLWQLPHFLAIAWMYRDDYARAQLPMLPVVDRNGGMTGRQATLWAATLVLFSLLPTAIGLTGFSYAIGALVLGLALLGVAINFLRQRSDANARLLFLGSITYLPLLWILMIVGRQ